MKTPAPGELAFNLSRMRSGRRRYSRASQLGTGFYLPEQILNARAAANGSKTLALELAVAVAPLSSLYDRKTCTAQYESLFKLTAGVEGRPVSTPCPAADNQEIRFRRYYTMSMQAFTEEPELTSPMFSAVPELVDGTSSNNPQLGIGMYVFDPVEEHWYLIARGGQDGQSAEDRPFTDIVAAAERRKEMLEQAAAAFLKFQSEQPTIAAELLYPPAD